jgi:hypothetical protein
MTTIDNIMALADAYAEQMHRCGIGRLSQDNREALRATLIEGLTLQTNKPAWKCTGGGLKKYLTQTQYDAQTENIKAWYEPICMVV